jgi:uncharacterized protein (TIGR02145 family)
MEKSRITFALTGALLILSFLSTGMKGNMDSLTGSVQTKTQSTQTTTKTTQTNPKTTQTTTKTTQTTTKSTQTTTKSTQTKPTQTKTTTTKPTQSKTTQKKSTTKPTQTKPKPAQAKPAPATTPKAKEEGTVKIGTQTWSSVNLVVSTFRNGDSIPEAKTPKEWVAAGSAGKPAWCYYNNDPAMGKRFGKLYNWYAVSDPRGLAPAGWKIPSEDDWSKLAGYLGGQQMAGNKMKSTSGWIDGNNGTNESGFNGFPGGYRVENGSFLNVGNIGTWWSSTESKNLTAVDFYLVLSGSFNRSNNSRQRGESVRCLKE